MTRSVAAPTCVPPCSRRRYSSCSASPETPDRIIPSRPITGGRGEKCARNSSYVASTRWTCIGRPSIGWSGAGRARLDEALEAVEVVLEDPGQHGGLDAGDDLGEKRRDERLAPPDDRRRVVRS